MVLFRVTRWCSGMPYFELNLRGARDMLQVGAGKCTDTEEASGTMRKSGGQFRGAERRGTVEGRFEKLVYRS